MDVIGQETAIATGAAFLEHHGIKGMHWGQRKGASDGGSEVGVKMRAGKRLKTSGGKHLAAHPDAIETAISRQKARRSSTDALSTRELQTLVNRMNLEQQFNRLANDKSTIDVGHDYVKKALAAGKTANEISTFVNSPAGKVVRASLKTALASRSTHKAAVSVVGSALIRR